MVDTMERRATLRQVKLRQSGFALPAKGLPALVVVWLLACEAEYVGQAKNDIAGAGGLGGAAQVLSSSEAVRNATGTGGTASIALSSSGAVGHATGTGGAASIWTSASGRDVLATGGSATRLSSVTIGGATDLQQSQQGTGGTAGTTASTWDQGGKVHFDTTTTGGTGPIDTTQITGGVAGSGPAQRAGGANTTATTSPVGGANATGGSSALTTWVPRRLWSAQEPRGTQVRVCWLPNAAAGNTAEGQSIDALGGYSAAVYRKLVRTAAENTWGRFANITFTTDASSDLGEWPSCGSAAPANTVALDFTVGPEQATAGASPLVPTVLRLHVPNSNDDDFVQDAIRSFGIALGTMSPGYAGTLQPEHIATAVQIYGPKHGGALVSWGGHCLDIDQAPEVRDFYLDVVAKNCDDRAPQYWRPYEIPGAGIQALVVRYDFAGYCATIYPNSTRLQTGDCGLGWHWALPLQNLHLIGWGNQCVTASSSQVGARLTLSRCSDFAYQNWNLFDNWAATIQLSGSSLCISTATDADATTGSLALAPCNPNAREQSFDLSAHSLVRYDRNVCMAALGGSLVLAPSCDGALPEQSFYVSGVIRSPDVPGCLILPDPPVPGAVAQFGTCDSALTSIDNLPFWQTWDYYW